MHNKWQREDLLAEVMTEITESKSKPKKEIDNGIYVDPYGFKTQLDLWSMRDNESGQLTREILLLGSPIKRN